MRSFIVIKGLCQFFRNLNHVRCERVNIYTHSWPRFVKAWASRRSTGMSVPRRVAFVKSPSPGTDSFSTCQGATGGVWVRVAPQACMMLGGKVPYLSVSFAPPWSGVVCSRRLVCTKGGHSRPPCRSTCLGTLGWSRGSCSDTRSGTA